MKTKNSAYLVLTIIFVILSAIGGYFLYQITNRNKTSSVVEPETTPIPTQIPTETPIITITPIATESSIASSSTKIKSTPTPKITISPVCTPPPCPTGGKLNCPSDKQCPGGCGVVCVKPTLTPTPVESTPTLTTYTSTEDGFSIDYLSSRKVYPDTENSGRRYTFYLYGANFAVHVGLNDQWSWTTPNRNFSGDFLVSGQNTYRYDISTQTIVDISYNGKNYTIQCVHNGKESLKTECEEFISSFQLL